MAQNRYSDLRERQKQEFSEFPIFWAYNKEQFEKGMAGFGLKLTDKDRLYSLRGGGFYLKTDSQKLKDLLNRHVQELESMIEKDEGFIFEMFDYELSNHEFNYTNDLTDTLAALGITPSEIKKNPALKAGLRKALNNY